MDRTTAFGTLKRAATWSGDRLLGHPVPVGVKSPRVGVGMVVYFTNASNAFVRVFFASDAFGILARSAGEKPSFVMDCIKTR